MVLPASWVMTRSPAGRTPVGPASLSIAWHSRGVSLSVLLGAAVALLVVWVALLWLLWLLRPRDVTARELIRVIPDVVRLLRSMIADRTVPLDARLVLVGLVAWIVSPIDLIPEFVPGLGPLDDVVVAVLAMRYVRWRVGVEGIRGRWRGTEDGFALLVRVIGG
jgi:uncharacterized membrane protein YkvA (DUF1232 family)